MTLNLCVKTLGASPPKISLLLEVKHFDLRHTFPFKGFGSIWILLEGNRTADDKSLKRFFYQRNAYVSAITFFYSLELSWIFESETLTFNLSFFCCQKKFYCKKKLLSKIISAAKTNFCCQKNVLLSKIIFCN